MTTQAPIHSDFGATSTAAEVMGNRRLDGKLAIVTGGYVGIGLETTRVLANAGAHVIVPIRPGSEEKARAALIDIPRVTTGVLELSDPASVDAFAKTITAPVHYLFNNAGVMAIPFAKNGAGFEMQLATNHLGHWQLTARLFPLLKAADATVVALTSRGHAFGSIDLDDPNFEHRPYDKWKAYGQSKTANALFALALNERGVRALSVHPGAVTTDLARYVPADELAAMRAKNPRAYKNPEQGAATSIWAAFTPEIRGVYCEDCNIAEPLAGDSPEPRGIRPWAMDAALAERLWSKTEEWTGVR